ncbi:MAG: SWIM zinc finger family protein [Parachlamydiaceae bacterium]|nr:SWIM zinc finger family protein [Parachlamydiaceae bacterium]
MGYYGKSRYGGSEWAPYVPVAERKAKAVLHAKSLQKKGQKLNPIEIEGRTIAKTFWGKAWCDNLESYSDYSNRLPRGRTYVRNGSVIDLQVSKGQIDAQVMGSSLYKINIAITAMPQSKWSSLVKVCSGKIDSLIELLQGKFSKSVMEIITQREGGLFPKPQEIKMRCSCPDSAGMCKHIAAVLYGVGASLDLKPEWLFALRYVDHGDLISSVDAGSAFMQGQKTVGGNVLEDGDLSALFGIEMDAIGSSASSINKNDRPAKEKPSPKVKLSAKAATPKGIKKVKTTAKSTTKTATKVKAVAASKAKKPQEKPAKAAVKPIKKSKAAKQVVMV